MTSSSNLHSCPFKLDGKRFQRSFLRSRRWRSLILTSPAVSYPVNVVQPVVSDLLVLFNEVVSLRVKVAFLHLLFQVEGCDGDALVTVNGRPLLAWIQNTRREWTWFFGSNKAGETNCVLNITFWLVCPKMNVPSTSSLARMSYLLLRVSSPSSSSSLSSECLPLNLEPGPLSGSQLYSSQILNTCTESCQLAHI